MDNTLKVKHTDSEFSAAVEAVERATIACVDAQADLRDAKWNLLSHLVERKMYPALSVNRAWVRRELQRVQKAQR